MRLNSNSNPNMKYIVTSKTIKPGKTMEGFHRSRKLLGIPSHSLHRQGQHHSKDSRYQVVLTPSIIFFSILLPAFIAFGIGLASKFALEVSDFGDEKNAEQASSRLPVLDVTKAALLGSSFTESFDALVSTFTRDVSRMEENHVKMKDNEPKSALPVPRIFKGKNIPLTKYTWEEFPAPGSANVSTIHISDAAEGVIIEKDDVHFPSGQHLLVDIRHVSPSFLNSQQALATAMITLINESELTLLSYHCHSLVPIGVSCAGVLLESHIAFHTWPTKGVITLDLFTCGAGQLIPILGTIERLFSVPPTREERMAPRDNVIGNPIGTSMVWAHKLRGFREEFSAGYDSADNPLDYELGQEVLNRLSFSLKDEVISTTTKFQNVDIFDVVKGSFRSQASYQKSIAGTNNKVAGSCLSCHSKLVKPDRVLYLGGVHQSSLLGDAPYHEALVHPVMIAHPDPRRVAIIGGGEGETLREVLKHSTVEEIVMVDIDEELISLAKEYLKEWNDCSDLVDSNVQSCFDHPRANIFFFDAMRWFIERYNDNSIDEKKFDVIIMDALDPNNDVDIVNELYSNTKFLQSLYTALNDDGAFIFQLGQAPTLKSPPDEYGSFQNRAQIIRTLESLGVESIHPYAEGHCGFSAPWTFLSAFKDGNMRSNWYRNPTEIDVQIGLRLLKTESGRKPLRYFDGASMKNYQIPPKSYEAIQCLIRPNECSVKNPDFSKKAYFPFFERHLSNAKTLQSHLSSYDFEDIDLSYERLKKLTYRRGNKG